jgi:hypothetical protein
MKNHLYFHSSNLDQLKYLKEDIDFYNISQYSDKESSNRLQYEYGKIETQINSLHLIVGCPPQKNCPWCSGESQIVMHSKSEITGSSSFCVRCNKCGSQGPVLNITRSAMSEKEMEEFNALLWNRYNRRVPWDKGFINPYEGQNK